MDIKPQSGSSNDDLLVSWKDVAAYLKCSVRKAQRLESRGLPVHRIPGTKSIWTSKVQVERWLISQAAKAEENVPPGKTIPAPTGVMGRAMLPLLAVSIGLMIWAAMTSAYGLTILFFSSSAILAVLAYPLFRDSALSRGLAAFFAIAGMSYCASATTLPDALGSIVNMTTVRPAFAYPFVAGVRFIPIPILIALTVIALAPGHKGFAQTPRLRYLYLGLGFLSILAVAVALVWNSGVGRIWHAGLPIRWTLLAGESFVLAVNTALFAFGYQFFHKTLVKNCRQLMAASGIAYLLIALTAAITNHHWSDINKYYLDVRRPQPYRIEDRTVADDFHSWLKDHKSEAGTDLITLFDDPEFMRSLETKEFYKQDFDDAFEKGIIFGYKADSRGRERPAFVRFRLPISLTAALRFRPVAQ